MRGKLLIVVDIVVWVGITPADAGKTNPLIMGTDTAVDHPRGCGENWRKLQRLLIYRGSPPRMRGKLNRITEIAMAGRITPADAGKTYCRCGGYKGCQDHPRGCGENVERRCRWAAV